VVLTREAVCPAEGFCNDGTRSVVRIRAHRESIHLHHWLLYSAEGTVTGLGQICQDDRVIHVGIANLRKQIARLFTWAPLLSEVEYRAGWRDGLKMWLKTICLMQQLQATASWTYHCCSGNCRNKNSETMNRVGEFHYGQQMGFLCGSWRI
jgi:hypothetical protein